MPEGVPVQGADPAISTFGFGREQEVGGAIGRMAVRDDTMEGDIEEAGTAAELPEHAVDGGPVAAITAQ